MRGRYRNREEDNRHDITGNLATDIKTKKECNLSQSNVDSFVKRVAKKNSENNSDRFKIYNVFLIDSLVLVTTLV